VENKIVKDTLIDPKQELKISYKLEKDEGLKELLA